MGERILEKSGSSRGLPSAIAFEMSTEGGCGKGKVGMKGDVGIKSGLRTDHRPKIVSKNIFGQVKMK